MPNVARLHYGNVFCRNVSFDAVPAAAAAAPAAAAHQQQLLERQSFPGPSRGRSHLQFVFCATALSSCSCQSCQKKVISACDEETETEFTKPVACICVCFACVP